MNKYKLVLEYDGTNYSGWQAQKNARSIQGTLLDAAAEFLKVPAAAGSQSQSHRGGREDKTQTRLSIPRRADAPGQTGMREADTGGPNSLRRLDIQGAGRTDAGVHALGQVAHLECERKLNCETLRIGINDLLPAGINILSVENAHPRFHARHSARSRSYLYLIARRRTAFGKKYVWWVKDNLHTGRMKQALAVFEGFHDFVSFADKRMDKDTSTKVDLEAVSLKEFGDILAIRLVGSHFLWKMVRRIVGLAVEAGRGNLTARDIELMLRTYSEVPAQHTAPPSGLFLEKVLYDGDTLPEMRTPVCLL